MAPSESTIQTVKSTVPALQEHGGAIVLEFYKILFERYPSVKSYFNMDRQKGGVSEEGGLPSQVSALARAVLAYAKNIDNVEVLLPVVESIGHKHVSRGVEAAHYDAVGECLLAAISAVLGAAATDEVLAAWGEAFGFLAETFVATEKRIREAVSKSAGYDGFSEMSVRRVEKGDKGSVLEMAHVSGAPAPPHAEGQFVSISIGDGDQRTTTSMPLVAGADGESDGLRVLVKESAERATRFLLDDVSEGSVLRVSAPCGVHTRT